MEYQVEITDVALAEAEEAYLWMMEQLFLVRVAGGQLFTKSSTQSKKRGDRYPSPPILFIHLQMFSVSFRIQNSKF